MVIHIIKHIKFVVASAAIGSVVSASSVVLLRYGQVSLAAVNQICVIYEAMDGCKKSKDSSKDCFENVNITYNNLLISSACIFTLCIARYLTLNIGISMKDRISWNKAVI